MDQKGLDLLVEAYAKIVKQIAYPLIIAGDGPDKKKLEARIEQLDISKQVQLVGFADKKTKKELLSKSAFVAFPSRNEGFSLFSLEAIASGHRLVTFDIPSLSFAPSDVARKVKAFNVKNFAEALLTESKETNHETIIKHCRGFAKKYSWDDVTDQFENFFQKIVTKSI
jgi:glycosyltransferase involved in cell wall biosynthesis